MSDIHGPIVYIGKTSADIGTALSSIGHPMF